MSKVSRTYFRPNSLVDHTSRNTVQTSHKNERLRTRHRQRSARAYGMQTTTNNRNINSKACNASSYQSCAQLCRPVQAPGAPTVPGDDGRKRRRDSVPGGDATHDHYDGAEFMPLMSGRRRDGRKRRDRAKTQ